MEKRANREARAGLGLPGPGRTMLSRRAMSHALALAMAGWCALPLDASAPSPTDAARQARRSAVRTLMREPLAPIPAAEVSVITLTLAPGSNSQPHEHTGPVFAYILQGEIENQVDPDPPRRYRAGDYFYEPPRHVHRMMRNLSSTQPAVVLVFQVGETGKKFTIPAPGPH
ncbi:MAG TPA: cupin domain-containing protein [Terriglobales bacterium]|nr:cupin domain-containing protein [Terriglobales bacterium]